MFQIGMSLLQPALVGTQELMIVLVVVLVLFGGKKIPELLRGVGRGVGELQKGLDEGRRQIHQSMRETEDEGPTGTEPRRGDSV